MKEFNWEQIQETFNTAVALQGRARHDYLESLGRQDKLLQSEVLSLLSADTLGEILPHSSAVIFPESETEKPLWGSNNPKGTAKSKIQMIGETLEKRYLIKKHIGSGGMGEVFLAEDKNVMSREVIVKLLRSDALENQEIVRKFKQEVEALARIKDEGIVTIYDFGTYGEQPFLVLEYVEGEDLGKVTSPILFGLKDFIAPEKIAQKLREQKTVEMAQVWSKLTDEARRFLKSPDQTLVERLCDEFNRLLNDWSLYNQNAFEVFRLSPKTAQWLKTREDDDRTIEFNRSLLEDLFTEEIVKGESKRLTPSQVSDIFKQLCVSLAAGHRKGIIHRDLKPANIMLSESEGRGLRVKLIDFGVARVRESLIAPTTEHGMSFGTQNYMAPEQLSGKKHLTPAVDIYALGLIALELLTGENPFFGKTVIEQYQMQENRENEFFKDQKLQLSTATAEVISKALAFEPEDRYPTAPDFAAALSESLSEENNETVTMNKRLTSSNDVTEQLRIEIPVIPDKMESVSNLPDISINVSPSEDKPNKIVKKMIWAALIALIIVIPIGGIGWWMWKTTGQANPSEKIVTEKDVPTEKVIPKETRDLSYRLIVQKYFEGKPFQKPFEATGDEIFSDGWRFHLALSSPQSGNLYLLSDDGETPLTMLFPHPQKNNGNSEIKANQTVETGEMEFDKTQGREKFFIIWTAKPIDELEAVKNYVNPQDLGRIKDASKLQAVRDFINKNSGKEKLTEQNDTTKNLKTLQIPGDVLIKSAEFRHN